MNIGVVGLGGIFEVAYWPAFQAFQKQYPDKPLQVFGYAPQVSSVLRNESGLILCDDYIQLLQRDLDLLFILTPPETHYPLLVDALESTVAQIVIEKPVVPNLAQLSDLKALLANESYAKRVLALDHWTGRDGLQNLLTGQLDASWKPLFDEQPPHITPIQEQDIQKLEGFLLEPCGFNDAGEPIALNFATGEEDKRQFFHPDGVILDIGTHVLTMMRECLAQFLTSQPLTLQAIEAKDRLGRDIEFGDLTTAEGHALLQGKCGSVAVTLHLSKYFSLEGGEKGMKLTLNDGRQIVLDRQGQDDLLSYHCDGKTWQWIRYGALYQHTIFDLLLSYPMDENELMNKTQRRIEEVESLLSINQQLRGPH